MGNVGSSIGKQIPTEQLLRWGQNQLSGRGGPQEAKWLLEWALEATSLLTAPRVVGRRAEEKYRSAVHQRRNGFPLQHITGRMSFRKLDLLAGPGVFVVRPETELLVEYALDKVASLKSKAGTKPLRVADLCTGSGAIALSLASEESDLEIDAVELSLPALKYAYKNHQRYRDQFNEGSSVRFIQDDATKALPNNDEAYDLVVSNPPYVPGMPTQWEALFDPEMALYGGGEDGMVIPRGIVVRAFSLLRSGGVLLLEHDDTQAQKLTSFALQTGFSAASSLEDLTGTERFLVAVK